MFDFHSFIVDFSKMFIFTSNKHSFHSKNFKFQILNFKKFKTKKLWHPSFYELFQLISR